MDSNLPALVVVVPLISALLIPVVGRWWRGAPWVLVTASLGLSCIGSWQLLATVVFVALGALGHWPGLLGLGVTLVSWGGLLGLTLPMDMPERFSRLVVMNTGLGTAHRPPGASNAGNAARNSAS